MQATQLQREEGARMNDNIKGRRYKSAAELGLVPAQRKPAAISRIEPKPQRSTEIDKPRNEVAYRAQRGEHVDRANAFVRVSMPISVCSALAFVCVSWLGLGIPVFSIATLAIMFSIFTLTYFGTWLVSNIFTHYGVQIFSETLRHNRLVANDKFMRQEFKERYKNEQ